MADIIYVQLIRIKRANPEPLGEGNGEGRAAAWGGTRKSSLSPLVTDIIDRDGFPSHRDYGLFRLSRD